MKYLATLLFVLWSLNIHAQVEIVAETNTEKNVALMAINKDVIPYTIRLEFDKLGNLESPDGNVIYAVANPGKTNLVKLKSPYLNGSTSFNYNSKIFKGSYLPNEVPSYHYLIPVEEGKKVSFMPFTGKKSSNYEVGISKVYEGVEFYFEKASAICAPRKGIITEIKMDSEKILEDPDNPNLESFIEIYHQDGTFSRLSGLMESTGKIQVGQVVFPGQALAESLPMPNGQGFHLKMTQSGWYMEFGYLVWISFPVILTNGQKKIPSNSTVTNFTTSHPEELVTLEMDKKEVKNYFKK